MERIASFSIDHDTLKRGMYISRIDKDIVTYDLRFREPNKPPFMENAAMHTIEHLFATFARNSRFKDSVVYFGPMGCRTGFYLLLRDDVSFDDAIELVKEISRSTSKFEGEIPGAQKKECGNYLEHDLDGAKKEAEEYFKVIENWTTSKLKY